MVCNVFQLWGANICAPKFQSSNVHNMQVSYHESLLEQNTHNTGLCNYCPYNS